MPFKMHKIIFFSRKKIIKKICVHTLSIFQTHYPNTLICFYLALFFFFQELRVEDYVANRKGKQAGSTFGFGTTPAATTQATTGFTFGQTKPAGFGASSKCHG